jgi:hypothetical protein
MAGECRGRAGCGHSMQGGVRVLVFRHAGRPRVGGVQEPAGGGRIRHGGAGCRRTGGQGVQTAITSGMTARVPGVPVCRAASRTGRVPPV